MRFATLTVVVVKGRISWFQNFNDSSGLRCALISMHLCLAAGALCACLCGFCKTTE